MNGPGTAQTVAPNTLWRTTVGWLCVAGGVAGLVLPVIPGIPLLAVGLVALSTRYRWAGHSLTWLKQKTAKIYPWNKTPATPD